MSNYDGTGKKPNYRQMNFDNSTTDHSSCSESKRIESNKYNNEEALQRMQKEAEEELENARRTFMSTENKIKQSRAGNRPCPNSGNKSMKRPVSKPCANAQPPLCKQNSATRRAEALQNLSHVTGVKECRYSGPKSTGRSGMKDTYDFTEDTELDDEPGSSGGNGNERRELPKKPQLTNQQLYALLKEEALDTETAATLISDIKESYKKPCPKQQKAKDAAKAVMEPKKEEPSVPCIPLIIIKEPAPLVDPDPEDMSPEVAANMIYMQERGIKMISCPDETVKHLFSEHFPDEDVKAADEEEKHGDEKKAEAPEEETEEGVDDSVFTRNMTQSESGEEDKASSKYYDAANRTSDKKREFLLQKKVAKCTNKVQLRGNVAPWFPGYFVAFPDQIGDNDIQLAKSPSEVFQRAWMAAKPSRVQPTDVYLVE